MSSSSNFNNKLFDSSSDDSSDSFFKIVENNSVSTHIKTSYNLEPILPEKTLTKSSSFNSIDEISTQLSVRTSGNYSLKESEIDTSSLIEDYIRTKLDQSDKKNKDTNYNQFDTQDIKNQSNKKNEKNNNDNISNDSRKNIMKKLLNIKEESKDTDTIELYENYVNMKETLENASFNKILVTLEKLSSNYDDETYYFYVRDYKIFVQQMLLLFKTIVKDLLEILILVNEDSIHTNMKYINNVILSHIKDIEVKMTQQNNHMDKMIKVIYKYGKEIGITEKSLKLTFGCNLLKMEFLLISFLKKMFEVINTNDIQKIKNLKQELITILEKIERFTNESMNDIKSDLRSIKNLINIDKLDKNPEKQYKLLKLKIKDTIGDVLKLYNFYIN